MHFAVIVPPFPSHVSSLDAVAAALSARGHRVTLVQRLDVGRFPRTAMAFRPIGLASHRAGSLGPILARAARPGGILGIRRIVRDMVDGTELIAREAPAALQAMGAEAVIADQMEPAAGLVAEHLGLPFVSFASAVPIEPEPAVPPPVVGWGYDPSETGRGRIRGARRVERFLMRDLDTAIAMAAARLGVARRRDPVACLSPLASLSQLVPGLDFPREGAPVLHLVGPCRLPVGEPAADHDLPVAGDRPLVFVSLGTLQGGRADLLARIARACRAAGAETVVAHCGQLTAAEAAAIPADHVAGFVDQRAIMRRAALVVTHAGVNTVLDAAAAGLPMLALPIAFDQPGMAARIRHAGAGLVLNYRFATERRLRRTIERLLGEAEFRRAAGRLRAEIASSRGAEQAADLVLKAVTSGRPVRREAA